MPAACARGAGASWHGPCGSVAVPNDWANWSGSLRFRPGRIETPADEEALCAVVGGAADDRRTVRVVGAGHSSSPLVETHDVLVSLERFRGLESHDRDRCEAVVRAGTTVHEAGRELRQVGLSLHNTGDVDVQTLTGAIGTGTHGTGRTLGNLSSALIGVRMVTAQGEVVERALEDDPDFLCAARVALGSLGIYTAVRMRLRPAFRLRRREWCTHVDDCLAHLDELIERNRNFDFYWYPRSDETKLRTLNPPDDDFGDPPYARCVKDQTGWANEVLPRKRQLKFDEMEYALPAEAGPACFREVRARVKAVHRRTVAWRILYRTVAADEAYLSPAHGRDTVTISLHQNAGLPFREYFADVEPIFRAHGGRPHWGKKHNLKADELRPLYPEWDRFLAARAGIDPDGTFLNPHLRDVFGLWSR